MKKVAILFNPHSGRGFAGYAAQQARHVLWGWPLEILSPSSVDELHRLCGALDPDRYEGLVVVGGDGTINQAVRALRAHHENPVPICPFPAGTANDLAEKLRIRPDWEQIQLLLDHRRIEEIDCLAVNGAPFATVAGLGIGSKLTSEYNARRSASALFRLISQTLRNHVYTGLSAKTLLFRNDYFHRLHIRSENFDEKIRTPVVFVCNQSKLGARLTVAPESSNNDGRFHVMIVPRTRKHDLMMGLVALRSGIIPPDFLVFSTSQLEILDLDGRSIEVFGDGETLTESPELRFDVESRRLRVYSGRDFVASESETVDSDSDTIEDIAEEVGV